MRQQLLQYKSYNSPYHLLAAPAEMMGWEVGAGVVGGNYQTERVWGAPQSRLPIHLSKVKSSEDFVRKLELYVLTLQQHQHYQGLM